VRLAIVAAPPLALVTIATLGLALRPHRPPTEPTTLTAPRYDFTHQTHCTLTNPLLAPRPACESAHALMVRGHVTGGATHVKLAGPILYTDVTTNGGGDFVMTVPVDGNVCDLLPMPQHFAFAGVGMTVRYDIGYGW